MLFDLSKYKGRIAYEMDDGTAVTYDAILELTQQIQQKIGSRKLVLLLVSNSVGALAYYIALLNSRNVVLLLDAGMDNEDKKNYFKRFQPDYICEAAGKECLCRRRSGMDSSQAAECVDFFMGYTLQSFEWNTTKELYLELALLLPTSGTTGSTKLVRLSYQNILANTRSIISYLQISDKDRPVLTLPASYSYGLSIIHTHIASGAHIFLTQSKIFQKEFLEFCRRKKITSFSGVPYSYEILDRFRFFDNKKKQTVSRAIVQQESVISGEQEDVTLQTMTQAGGHLRNDLQEKIADYAIQHHIRFYVMYGQTEATARMSYVPYEMMNTKEKIGSIGIPVPGTKLEIADEKGKRIEAPFQKGEIVFCGENVSLGYAQNSKDLQKGDENAGRLYTGDIGYKDEDGYFYISGRKSRFLKICGKRMCMDEVEKKLKKRFEGMDCAVLGNDKLLSVYIDHENRSEVMEYLQKKFHLSKSQIQIFVLQKLPRGISGKIQYQTLNDICKAQES